jgi:catechol 2,3-dioxygenase-like lactoylglutathione lyase family enzyme
MKIKVTSIYVDDQDRALRFYTEVLGFAKEDRFQSGPLSLADRGVTRGAGRH